jgi:HPr kinase/phosphorylase
MNKSNLSNFMTVHEFINQVIEDKIILVHEGDLTRKIYEPGVSKAGVDFLDIKLERPRVKIIGTLELSLMKTATEEQLGKIFQDTPLVILTKNQILSDKAMKVAIKYNTSVFVSQMSSSLLSGYVYFEVSKRINPAISWHGVLLNVFGVGVIIQGQSGIGKSEIAIELVSRGHQLISDDRIIIREIYPGQLLGICPALTSSLLELRGVGVVSISDLYGAQTVAPEFQIDLIIQLEKYIEDKEYLRLIGHEVPENIFATQVSKKIIPVSTGRNMSAIIEAAVNNFILKKRNIKTGFEILEERLKNENK